jgi:hypothetical protein
MLTIKITRHFEIPAVLLCERRVCVSISAREPIIWEDVYESDGRCSLAFIGLPDHLETLTHPRLQPMPLRLEQPELLARVGDERERRREHGALDLLIERRVARERG